MSMHQIGQRYHDSINKLFGYIGLLLKEDVVIEFDSKYSVQYKAPRSVSISQTLFQTDSCHSSGKCCKVAFDLAYTREGYSRAENAAIASESAAKLVSALVPVATEINGKKVEVWVHLNDKVARYTGLKTCDYLENPQEGPFAQKFICGLHGGYNRVFESAQPFHCIAPHFVVRSRLDGCSFIGRMQFGRNWRFGCPVVFKRGLEYFDKDYRQDLDKLLMMLRIAEDMKVKTWIPEIIEWLRTNEEMIKYMAITGDYKSIPIFGVSVDDNEGIFDELEDVGTSV